MISKLKILTIALSNLYPDVMILCSQLLHSSNSNSNRCSNVIGYSTQEEGRKMR